MPYCCAIFASLTPAAQLSAITQVLSLRPRSVGRPSCTAGSISIHSAKRQSLPSAPSRSSAVATRPTSSGPARRRRALPLRAASGASRSARRGSQCAAVHASWGRRRRAWPAPLPLPTVAGPDRAAPTRRGCACSRPSRTALPIRRPPHRPWPAQRRTRARRRAAPHRSRSTLRRAPAASRRGRSARGSGRSMPCRAPMPEPYHRRPPRDR